MLLIYLAAASGFAPNGILRPHTPSATRRSDDPRAVTFVASRKVTSASFDASTEGLCKWFGMPEAVEALCSMADETKFLDADRIEVTTLIPFPGAKMKSVTTLEVAKDLQAPSYSITTLSSETVCETGPQWVRNLLVSVLGATKSTSDNKVSVITDGSGSSQILSDVTLRVDIAFPGFLPLPQKQVEREGSKSLQSVLDQQMTPVLARFRSDYLQWAAKNK